MNSPRTPMLAERSRTAPTNAFTVRSIGANRSLLAWVSAWIPTPRTTTGMRSRSMSRVIFARWNSNSGRNAFASGTTYAS